MTRPVVEAANQADPAIFIGVPSANDGRATPSRTTRCNWSLTGQTTVDEAMRISNQFDDA